MRRGCGVARGCAAGDEGSRMIVPSGAVRVLVATRPVDFRKGMDGLAALVRETLGSDPYSGVIYVFRDKRANRVTYCSSPSEFRQPLRLNILHSTVNSKTAY